MCDRGAGATGGRARQDSEHDHGATAGRASIGRVRWDGILDRFGGRFLRWRVEQPATERELGGALAVGEAAVVADAMEAVRQGVQQEAPDELVGRKRHEPGLAVMAGGTTSSRNRSSGLRVPRMRPFETRV